MKSYTYLTIDIACILIPLLASFYPKHCFARHWKSFFIPNTIVGIFFISWDMIFTNLDVWGFNPDYLTGIKIYNLPIEEILFFVCIPYACTFTYFALEYFIKQHPLRHSKNAIHYFLLVVSLFFVIVGYKQLYTFYTGLFTGIFVGWCIYKNIDLSKLFFVYLVILPFFFLSNGILTGSMLSTPVVYYNNADNFGLRILTIPIEDSIYGFLLIAMNGVGFDLMRAKNNK